MEDIEKLLTEETASILGIDSSDVSPDAPLHSLGMDSLQFIELLIVLEKKVGVNLMESGLTREDFRTIRSLANSVRRLV